MIGKTLGHYEITGLLGKGGMGEVYVARDTKLGREVAIKLLPADLAADPQRRGRFEREARAIAALNHPNVVTIYAVEEADDQLFLVMERVHGVTLTRKIPDGGLPLREFFQLALPLSEALSVAHTAGITHRDLKPENVMVDDDGRLKVLDFGLAKILESEDAETDETMAVQTREGVILGTAAYMSPEQAEGKPTDARSDVFTIGILLYEMLTGRRPFRGDTAMSTLTSVLRDDPVPVVELRPELPREFQRILRRCLGKDPQHRYESARGIHNDLKMLREEILSGEYDPGAPIATVAGGDAPVSRDPMLSASQPPAGSIPPSAPSQPGVGPGRRNPLLLLVPLVLVVVVAAVWFQRQGGKDDEPGPGPTNAAVENPLVVVFPFENLGPPEDAYFAAGMTDEITTRLGAVRGLRVLSRTSSQQYDRTGKTMQQIADDLGVDFVLEGSVRWQRSDTGPSRIRVTQQLARASDGTQVWAEVFDRTMEEIFAVQSEIAGEVVERLGGALALDAPESPDERPTDDMTAYHAYLRGRELLEHSSYDPRQWATAIELLERAVSLDPQFAEAYGYLAKAHAGYCHFNWDPSEERLAQSKAAADRALALGPGLARSHIGMGYYYYWGLKDYAPALAEFERAAAIQPNDTEVLDAIAYIRRRQGRFGEAVEAFRRVIELDPGNASAYYNACETLGVLGRYEEALRAGEQAIQIAPDEVGNYQVTADVAHLMGRPEYAAQILESYPGAPSTMNRLSQFWIAYDTRDYATALRAAREVPPLERGQFRMISQPFFEGLVHRAMGRDDLALASFSQARKLFEDEMQGAEANSILVSTMGIILAATGEGEAGPNEARTALTIFPADRDVWIRQWVLANVAIAQAFAGQVDAAIATLDQLLSEPTNALSVSVIRSSPAFDDLRASDEFARLLEVRSRAD